MLFDSMVLMKDCEYNQQQYIQLSPYFHQVGGHSSMFQYGRYTVCKVLEPSELEFYQSMPEPLKKFTPEFRGIVTVQYCEDESGYIKLVAQPVTTCIDDQHLSNEDDLKTISDPSSTDHHSRKSVELCCSKDGHIDYSNSLVTDVVNYEQGKTIMSKINPWGLRLCKKQAEKLHQQLLGDENVSISREYMLLENVTAQFRYPCVLDLKMGKRQHADVDSDTKRLSKIQKCESSTSSTLGVRLCGMQVYQVDSDRYLYTDKYRGQVLTTDGFRSALVEYFDNGQTKRFDVIPGIIERLESLHETISFLSTYRFYSGSLLIVYDGLLQSNLIDIRMIDFAHSICAATTNETSASNNHVGPDKGYLFGLEHLRDVFKEILNEKQQLLTLAANLDN